VRRKPIPLSSKGQRNRRLRPKEPQTSKCQVRLKTARREPTGVARPRPEPRTPEKLASKAFDPPRKDAKPSPARQFGPGTSGGRWQHRLPFCFWGYLSPGRSTGWIARQSKPGPGDRTTRRWWRAEGPTGGMSLHRSPSTIRLCRMVPLPILGRIATGCDKGVRCGHIAATDSAHASVGFRGR
jgi:hypothetical protein